MILPPEIAIFQGGLINEFGLTPSPLFKTILSRMEKTGLTKGIKTRAAALKLVKKLGI
jgi:hypothetical protein